MSSSTAMAEFTRSWEQDGPRVAAYVRRHVPADDVQDVVAETFLQAWRRWDVVPSPPIAWLVGTARKVIGNHRRAHGRRAALRDRLVLLDGAASAATDAGMLATDRMAALQSLVALGDDQREALLLVAWDGLSPEEAASVLDVRVGTLRVRVHRARQALERSSTTDRSSHAITLAAETINEGGVR